MSNAFGAVRFEEPFKLIGDFIKRLIPTNFLPVTTPALAYTFERNMYSICCVVELMGVGALRANKTTTRGVLLVTGDTGHNVTVEMHKQATLL